MLRIHLIRRNPDDDLSHTSLCRRFLTKEEAHREGCGYLAWRIRSTGDRAGLRTLSRYNGRMPWEFAKREVEVVVATGQWFMNSTGTLVEEAHEHPLVFEWRGKIIAGEYDPEDDVVVASNDELTSYPFSKVKRYLILPMLE